MLSDLSDTEIPLERLCIGKELGEGNHTTNQLCM